MRPRPRTARTTPRSGTPVNISRRRRPRISRCWSPKSPTASPSLNAAVIFNPSKDGKDEGSLEVKTDPEGKAIVDIIPTGSLVRVQILANGFATFAEDYMVNEPTRQIAVAMISPRAQISTYEDNRVRHRIGRSAFRRPDDKPKTKAPVPPSGTPAPAKPSAPVPPPPRPLPPLRTPVAPHGA